MIAAKYPNAPRAGMPKIFGHISVVQMILAEIRRAASQKPITIFLTR